MSTYLSTFTGRKGTGLTVWASYCVLYGLLALLILQSTLVLSPIASAASKVGTQPEYLARTGVSVVRVVAIYSPPTIAPAAISTKTKSEATRILASSPITCTGLGLIIASWTDTTGGVNEQNAYILTDGSLVNPKEFSCGASSIPVTLAAKAFSLSSVKVYFSTAYNNVQQTPVNINTNTISCNAETCSDGVALLSFHSPTQLPLVKLPDTGSTTQPDQAAIQLGTSSSNVATPSITSALQQFLTPALGNASTFEGFEGGTPIVDQHGFLNTIYTKNGTKSKFVTADEIRTLLQSRKLMTDQQHPNVVNDSWQSGMTAYAKGPDQYKQANGNFKQAFAASNSQFQGAQTFIDATSPVSQGSSGTKTSGTSNNGITFPYIGTIPYFLLAIGAIGIIVLILLLVLLTMLFRRAQRNKDFLEADEQATIQAQKIQEKEAQQAAARAVPPRARQPLQKTALSPTQAPNGLVNTPSLASLSAVPAIPVQSSAIADYPTVDMGNVQRNEIQDLDKTQPFPPGPQPAAKNGGEEHVGFEVITNTNPGIKRKYKPNEDSLFAVRGMRNENGHTQYLGLFVVADGMGGHANGQDASRLAIQTIIDYLIPRLVHGANTQETAEKLLVDSVQLANQAVHQHNIEHNADMGTTVTATLIVNETAHVANVGDSRTYLYRTSDGLSKVTRDHSVVASLVDAGIIKPDDIYTHPKRNQIYRSLGEKPFVEVDPFTVQLQSGDKLLLCSDGLWDMVRDPEIKHVLETPTPDPQQLGSNLIAAALKGGGEDNVSVIVVNVVDRALQQTNPGLEAIYLQDNIKMPPLS